MAITPEHAVVDEQEEHHDEQPDRPAIRPWCSACLPSVAETWDSEISLRLIGSAPSRSWVARSCADWIVNPPVISAPLSAGIPSGYCL